MALPHPLSKRIQLRWFAPLNSLPIFLSSPRLIPYRCVGLFFAQFKGDFECPVPRARLEERDNNVWTCAVAAGKGGGDAAMQVVAAKADRWLEVCAHSSISPFSGACLGI
jgi:hypothetical protein